VTWQAEVVRPTGLDEALETLAARPGLRVLAGGTDVMVGVHAGFDRPEALLDVWGLDELRGVRVEDEAVVIGALSTYTDLIRAEAVAEHLPALAQAASEVGAIQIQNRGTIGGNVVNASPSGDSQPPLAVYEAELELRSVRGSRQVPFVSFYSGYKAMDLAADELLTALRVPLPPAGARHWFRKVGTRKAQAIAKVSAAALVVPEGDGTIGQARLALGAVAPTVIRLPETEGLLRGGRPGPELVEAVRASVTAEARPIDDVRSTAEYRRQVCGNIVARFLESLA